MENTRHDRFQKPDHFLTLATTSPLEALADVTDTYTLNDLRQELGLWQELALCNEDSAYAEAPARENLLAFMQAFQAAIEALYTTHLKNRKYQSPARAALNTLQLLSGHEQAHPVPVMRQFAETFCLAYTQAELLDLLEAVVSYRGKKKIQMESVVFVYQRLCFLAHLIYNLTTGERLPYEP